MGKKAEAREIDEFSSTEAAVCAGLSYRQLSFIVQHGVVTPSIRNLPGHGHHRRFSVEDIRELTVASQLRQLGVSDEHLRRALRAVRKAPSNNRALLVLTNAVARVATTSVPVKPPPPCKWVVFVWVPGVVDVLQRLRTRKQGKKVRL